MDLLAVTGAFPVRSQPFVTAKLLALAARGHRVSVLAGTRGDDDLDPGAVAALDGRFTVEYRAAGVLGRAAGAGWLALRALRDGRHFLPPLARAAAAQGQGRVLWRTLEQGLPFAGRAPDVVHFEWATKAVERLSVVDLLPAPVIVSCRGSDVNVLASGDPGFATGLRRILGRAEAVHCVTESVRRAAEALGCDPRRAVVIHPAVDIYRFSPGPPRPASSPLHVLSVGRLHWVKGYDYGLAAVRLLLDRGRDVRYTIVGGGDAAGRAAVHLAVRDLGLEDRVTLAGPVPQDEVRRLLRRVDVFLLPSLSEGMSNAVLEAMATGLPVVATDVGGMAELVREGTDGYLVPPRDPNALAARLECLLADARAREEMGRQARTRVARDFTLDRQIDRFEALYERVASGEAVPDGR